MATLKFLVFADFHYKKKMYAVTKAHLETILNRAQAEKCDFILHEGDFSNDYLCSPEVTQMLMNCAIPVFGVYGNHELECGATMQDVTPMLTNKPNNVVWGTPDGKIGDGSIAYYYYDTGDYRFVFLDATYSLMPDGETYEHNHPSSWGMPEGNTHPDSLGPVQLRWLDSVLTDAADKGLHCIVNAHPAFTPMWRHSPDTEAVQQLYRKANSARKHTVIMSINGHYHTNHIAKQEEVLYFDVNTSINGWWQAEDFFPYTDEKYTFDYVDYDENGIATAQYKMPLNDLKMRGKTLYFEEPLSAIVTIDSEEHIRIQGSKTNWMYGIKKEEFLDGTMPEIGDYQ